MQRKCAYCRKPLEEGQEVKMTILIIQGSQLQPVERNYCSKQCGQYDQMANEAERKNPPKRARTSGDTAKSHRKLHQPMNTQWALSMARAF